MYAFCRLCCTGISRAIILCYICHYICTHYNVFTNVNANVREFPRPRDVAVRDLNPIRCADSLARYSRNIEPYYTLGPTTRNEIERQRRRSNKKERERERELNRCCRQLPIVWCSTYTTSKRTQKPSLHCTGMRFEISGYYSRCIYIYIILNRIFRYIRVQMHIRID